MDVAFRALVLQALWLLLRHSHDKARYDSTIASWRGNAIFYMDEYGQQTDEAKKHRREVTFPELR